MIALYYKLKEILDYLNSLLQIITVGKIVSKQNNRVKLYFKKSTFFKI